MYRCTACCTNHKNISGGIVDLWSRFGQQQNAKCTQTLCLLIVTIHLIASVLVAKHCLKSKNEPSNMFYWCLIYKALLWLRLFDFSQLTFRRDIFPSKSSARVPTRSFEKILPGTNLRHLNVMSVWPFLQFGFSVFRMFALTFLLCSV